MEPVGNVIKQNSEALRVVALEKYDMRLVHVKNLYGMVL